MMSSNDMQDTLQIPMIIQGTWLLESLQSIPQLYFLIPDGRLEVVTHRGLYFACHINGATALPIQYADSITALTVIRLVWPAVTVDNQDSAKTNPVVPTPINVSKSG